MPNVTVHLGSTTPFSSRAGPSAPARHSCLSAPSPLSLPPSPAPQRQRVAVRTATCARARHVRVTAGRDTVGARPHNRPHAAWHPHGRTPLLLSSPFPSQSRRRPSSLQKARHRPRSAPSSQAPPPSPPFSRPYRRLRPLEASPSHWILASVAAAFPLSGERPPGFAIP
jgi:hypothetical protein